QPAARAPDPPALPGGLLPASYRVRPAVSATAEVRQKPTTLQPPQPHLLPVSGVSPRLIVPTPLPELPFACAVDYQWLVGPLYNDAQRDRWRACYSDGSLPDRYGGVLELVGTGPMNGFYSGQFVRVEGELIDPAPLETKPAYHVRALQGVVH